HRGYLSNWWSCELACPPFSRPGSIRQHVEPTSSSTISLSLDFHEVMVLALLRE
ncbi:unnamed protein product, partial [Ectocarpus sp. 13 AM-2016]